MSTVIELDTIDGITVRIIPGTLANIEPFAIKATSYSTPLVYVVVPLGPPLTTTPILSAVNVPESGDKAIALLTDVPALEGPNTKEVVVGTYVND